MRNAILDPKKHGISQGLLTVFMRCRQEAEYYVKGIKRPQESQALHFGSLAHQVLEWVYREYETPPTAHEVYELIELAILDFRSKNGTASAAELEYTEINGALLCAVLPLYFKHYKKDFKDKTWVELEEPFRIPFTDFNLIGRLDGVKRIKKKLWVFESKTKSRIEEGFLSDALTFDFQTNLYLQAVKSKYKEMPAGAIYNIIRRPGNRFNPKKGNLRTFEKLVRELVEKDPSHYFIRFEVATPSSEINRFGEELKIILSDFKEWFKERTKTYRNSTACKTAYGACKYLPLCANGDMSLYKKLDVYPDFNNDSNESLKDVRKRNKKTKEEDDDGVIEE